MLHSYHNFLFPFRFDKIVGKIEDRHEFYKDKTFDERVKIDTNFKELLERDGWLYKKFEIKTNLDYNEFSYFHDFARDTLFNINEFKEKATSYYFSKDINEKDTFSISIKGGKTYTLKLTGLSLRIFDTGVGILSIELENEEKQNSSMEDILKINDFGRRVYAQFLAKEDSDQWGEITKKSFLADKLEIGLADQHITETFDYTEIPKEIKIASYISELLGKNSFSIDKNEEGKNLIQPSIDDRMFVICWYGNDQLSEALKNYNYKHSDRWYEFVFIDGNGKTIESPDMQEKFITEASYDRWMNKGTMYGMSRYSFVSLSDTSGFAKDVLPLPHMKTMYFQMFTLLLAQRASLLRFSDEVTALSDIDSETLRSETQTSNLYKNYIRFVNKLYFREITPQDQGLEIYNQARDILKIDDDIKDLDNEVEELHRYVSMLEENSRNDKMDKLSKLGYIFLSATFIVGVFGMNILPKEWEDTFKVFLENIF